MGCQTIFLGVEPEQQNYVGASNTNLPVPIGLWENKKQGIPLDLTGYTARASLRNVATGVVTSATTATLTMTATNTDIVANWDKATIESLKANDPFIIDVGAYDASSGDSFDAILGIIYFIQGASV